MVRTVQTTMVRMTRSPRLGSVALAMWAGAVAVFLRTGAGLGRTGLLGR